MTPELGLIDGFFGLPWSWQERADAVEFLNSRGYRFYLYAPKADAFLRRDWDKPHPAEELERLAGFSTICRSAGMRFGIGLSPFELHLEQGSSWRERLSRKLAELDGIGIDDLALLFDDMRGDLPDLAARQAEIAAFAAERSGASRILFCPSYYSDDPVLDLAFGQRPDHYLQDLGRMLDPAIEIMWTGEEVCSREIGPGHLDRVAEAIRRKPFLWDNYPVNDGPRMAQHLHLRAFTGRPAAIAGHVAGHAINLASQPVLSRIPALTLVESYRAGADYRYGAAFDQAAREVVGPELAARLRRDLLSFQDRGRDRLSEARRAELSAIYAAFDHPAAREVVAWLQGRWEVDEESVRTQ